MRVRINVMRDPAIHALMKRTETASLTKHVDCLQTNEGASMKNQYLSRIEKALSLLKDSDTTQALVISSNPSAVRSRDTHFPYRQNSDLFYFTGTSHQNVTLILRPNAKEPVVLVAPPEDDTKKMWDGAQPSIAALAHSIKASVVISKDSLTSVRSLLRGTQAVYLQSVPGTVSMELRQEFAGRTAHSLRGFPSTVIEAERLTAVLRCIKEPAEIAAIEKAADLTSAVLMHTAQYMRRGIKERDIAVLIEYLYRLHGAEPAFNTIVATGKSAATLHYHSLERTLKNNELLLIDTGCELDMYACDVSRTIPVGPEISPVLREVYEIVLSSQFAAMSAIKPGVHITQVHQAAAKELTRGLKGMGVLKGSISELVKKAAYKPWFPHGIGHSLGIDVHDVSPGEQLGILQKGMVITIEPGLYFAKTTAGIPSCGVRIEDDVVVTSRGCEVLTNDVFPKTFDEMRALVS